MALRRRLLLLVVVVAAAVARCRADDPAVSMLLPGLPVAGLAVGFYNEKCPQAEDLVLAEMRTLVDKDETIGPALLRFMFHDCLVRVRTLPQPAFSSSAYCLIRASWMSFFFVVVVASRACAGLRRVDHARLAERDCGEGRLPELRPPGLRRDRAHQGQAGGRVPADRVVRGHHRHGGPGRRVPGK